MNINPRTHRYCRLRRCKHYDSDAIRHCRLGKIFRLCKMRKDLLREADNKSSRKWAKAHRLQVNKIFRNWYKKNIKARRKYMREYMRKRRKDGQVQRN